MKTLDREDVDKLVDEIVDEVLSTINKSKLIPNQQTSQAQTKKQNAKAADSFDRDGNVIYKLENRIQNLENRVEKFVNSFKISSVEFERELSERSTSLDKENEKQIMNLQGQIETLRTGMIRLGNELRRIRESLLRENLLK